MSKPAWHMRIGTGACIRRRTQHRRCRLARGNDACHRVPQLRVPRRRSSASTPRRLHPAPRFCCVRTITKRVPLAIRYSIGWNSGGRCRFWAGA